MNGALVVARRELRGYFNSPLAYIFLVALLVVSAVFFFFVGGFFAINQATLRAYFGLMPMILSILLPALTMR
ncbi:MAG: ABC transporter permease, partial [Spirochaetales bacterium]